MGAGLLMSHKNMFHPAFTFRDVESVVDGQNRPAGVAEDRVDAMTPQ